MLSHSHVRTATILVRLMLIATLMIALSRTVGAQAPAPGTAGTGQGSVQAPDAPAATDEGVVVVTASRREETLLNAPVEYFALCLLLTLFVSKSGDAIKYCRGHGAGQVACFPSAALIRLYELLKNHSRSHDRTGKHT